MISKYAGLGSIIQATPLIQTLRVKYPQARIIFVTTQGNAVLLDHIPEINLVLTVSDKNLLLTFSTSLKLISDLWRIKPELFIDLEFYSNYSGIICTLSKATNRLGFYNEDKVQRKGIHNYLLPFNVNSAISETYLQFAKLLGCKKFITELKIETNKNIKTNNISDKSGILTEDKYIVINPNASDLRIERRWPKESFITSIHYLLQDFPSYKILLIGNKTEAAYVREIESAIPANKNLINTAGKLNLSELIYIIDHAELLLTNDTGPMHIAYALNTKTISLFGPCSPEQYGQIKNALNFYKKVDCSPCVHTHILPPCKGNNICMKNITTNEVKSALKNSLS